MKSSPAQWRSSPAAASPTSIDCLPRCACRLPASTARSDARLPGSLAAHLLAVENGAAIIRTHDVAETVQALKVAAAIRSAR